MNTRLTGELAFTSASPTLDGIQPDFRPGLPAGRNPARLYAVYGRL